MSVTPDLSKRRIALIGGAGFIGHNLALTLKQLGADVQVLDGLAVNHLGHYASLQGDKAQRDLYIQILLERLHLLAEAGITLHRLDAREYHHLSRVLTEVAPDTIVHLAAVAHADRSNKDPHSTFDHSLRTLENALDWSRGAEIERFVFLSSSMVYGHFRELEVTEDHVLEPLGIYGALKVAGEKMIIAYNQDFGLPFAILRPSALY